MGARTFYNNLVGRLGEAILKRPGGRDWSRFLREMAWVVPLLLVFGHLGQLIAWRPALNAELVRLALLALIVPALGEELFFRVALLPRPASPRFPVWPVALSTALFVLWHPAQALVFGPHWAEVVLNPWFLAAVAALGLALSRLYLATGSIWPSVALHWLVVVGWKLLLGGPSPWLEA